MIITKRILAPTLLLILALCAFAAPGSAAADWRSQYAAALRGAASGKRAVALADVTGDGVPELCVVAAGAGGEGGLRVYAARADGVAALAMDAPVSMKGVKKVSMQWRKAPSGAPILDVTMTAAAEVRRVALAGDGAGGLKAAFAAVKARVGGKVRYSVDGAPVSASRFGARVRAYEASSKKAAQLPLTVLAKADAASKVDAKFGALAKKHAAYGAARSVAISAASAVLGRGESLALKAKVSPASAFTDAVQWISENERIATVSDAGVVKAVAAGTVKIYARTASGVQKHCALQVVGPKPTKLALDPERLTLIRGGGETLALTFEPSDAEAGVKWTTSNARVAAVDQKGRVLGVAAGEATVTATAENGVKAACRVVVTNRPAVVVDISQHEYSASMNWDKIKDSVDLMILRCGVTRTQTAPIGVGYDAKFAHFAKKCKEYGIPFGVYFYGKCDDAATAKAEAKMTWDVASPHKPLFYVYDVEEARLTRELIETYIKTLKSLGAKKTGLYIAHHLYASYKLDTKLVDFIWIPHYGKNDGTVNATPSYPCDMHQYTSVGKIAGIPGGVDVSRLMGDKTLSWYLKR